MDQSVSGNSETLLPSSPPEKPGRLTSLDVFRGITVAGMILVNNPGGPKYAPLDHAEWDGWTPTDLVFPWFLFIVGVSINYALSKRSEDPAGRSAVLTKILRRTLIIFGLGIALNGFPAYTWSTIRIPGVLQRIALCYLAASLIFLYTKALGQVLISVGLLIGYWLVMKYVPVPGDHAGDWELGKDLGSYLDRLILPGHLYRPHAPDPAKYDPEGILSTLPAIATTLIGVLAGYWLRSGRDRQAICSGMFVGGMVAIVAGAAWGLSFPVNKALWTSSFTLLTAGMALCGLATCYWLIDIQGFRRWAYPFRVFGSNPIAAYTLAGIGARVLNMKLLARVEADPISVHKFLYNDHLLKFLAPLNASLGYALMFVLACFLVIWILDLLNIHIRA